MLVFALVAAGIGLVMAAVSFCLPAEAGADAGTRTGPSHSPSPGHETRSSLPAGAHLPSATILSLVGLPLFAAGLVGAVLVCLERPQVTTIVVSLAVGLPVGLVCALILNRTAPSRRP